MNNINFHNTIVTHDMFMKEMYTHSKFNKRLLSYELFKENAAGYYIQGFLSEEAVKQIIKELDALSIDYTWGVEYTAFNGYNTAICPKTIEDMTIIKLSDMLDSSLFKKI